MGHRFGPLSYGMSARKGRKPGRHEDLTPAGVAIIEARMKELGLTVVEFCRAVGIVRQTWYRWKAGDTSSTPSLEAVARALQMDIQRLLDGQALAARMLDLFANIQLRNPTEAAILLGRGQELFDRLQKEAAERPLSEAASSSAAAAATRPTR